MNNCSYINKNGKMCGGHIHENSFVCNKHKKKTQKGGFIYELIYPLGASVGAATYTLFKLNNIVGDWYMKRNKNKLNKNNKK
jgi:hypothetical protein